MERGRRSEGERFEALKAALRERARYDDGAAVLADTLGRCGLDWRQKYRCRSPGCPTCRRANIRREQRAFRSMLDGAGNSDLALLTVVLPGTRDIDDVATILKKGVEDARNRVKACRRLSSRWDRVAILGWHEIDAVSADQLPLLPPDRRALLGELAPIDFDQDGATWVPTFHAIAYLGDVTADEFSNAMRQQWPLAGQINVEPFDRQKHVDDNLDRLVSYGNKFTCETDLSAAIKGGKLVEQWPAAWEAEFIAWLHRGRRNAFERLRFAIGPKADPRPRHGQQKAHQPVQVEVEPMPFVMSSMTGSPNFPWINTTGSAVLPEERMMRELMERMRASPAYKAMMARSEFETAGSVELRNWSDLDGASGWCERQWRDKQHGYRRTVDAGGRGATFEFADPHDAVFFKMRFG